MTPKITFITSLIRPNNLPSLEKSIKSSLENHLPWHWIVVADGKFVPSIEFVPPVSAHVVFSLLQEKTYGFYEKNTALDLIQEDTWVHFLDDDTDLHPNFYHLFSKSLTETPSAKCFVFGQLLPDDEVRAPKAGLDDYLGKIDMGQFIIKRSAIGFNRFKGAFGSDGEFFTRLYKSDPKSFVFKPDVGFNHNNLRVGEAWSKDVGYGRKY